MDSQKVVENIQKICNELGTTPTVAGEESGAGKSLVSNLKKRGVIPSVEKFQMLAQYLGVTTSELLGEEKKPTPVSETSEPDLLVKFNALSQDDQDEVLAIIELKLAKKSSRT